MAKAPRSLAGKVVAITGGAPGNRAGDRRRADRCRARGSAIGDIDAPMAEQTARELGGGTIGLALDVTERDSFDAFLTEVEQRLGPLDVLINNAGIMPIGPFVEETDATAARMIDINLNGVILGSKLALERFLPRGQRPSGQHRLGGRQGRLPGRGHLLRDQARRRRPQRGDPGRGPVHRHRRQHRDAGRWSTPSWARACQKSRGVKVVEPEDVANAIVEALQTGRVRRLRPRRSVKGLFRFMYLVPRPVADFISKVLKGDQVLVNPDHMVRAAYESAYRRSGGRGGGGPGGRRCGSHRIRARAREAARLTTATRSRRSRRVRDVEQVPGRVGHEFA